MNNIIDNTSELDTVLSGFFDNTTPPPDITSDGSTLSSDTFGYTLTLRRSDFDDEKMLVKFISSCERAIRCSPEYKDWVDYVREVMNTHTCALTGEISSEVKIEIHHHPMTLYDITKSVIYKSIDSNKDFCSFDIASTVIELHYSNSIGFVPLVTTLHQKVHNGSLSIPIEMVRGNYKEWMNNYTSHLDDEDVKRIKARESVTLQTCGWNTYKWAKDNYPCT